MKLRITVQNQTYDVAVEVLDGSSPTPAPESAKGGISDGASGAAPSAGGDVPSPIAGNVLDVKVKTGDRVNLNDTLLVLEAMKMESNIASPFAGVVSAVLVKPGDAVTAGQILVKL